MFIINTDIQYEENKIIIDADGTGGDVTLQFGTDINDYLKFNQSSKLFSFNADIDMQGFEIQKFSLEKLAAPPICDAASKGHLYYNTVDNNTYACDGSVWEDVTALATTSSKVVTVGSVNADYATISAAAAYLNTLSGGIILLSAETHIINSAINLRNITLVGKDDMDTTIQFTGAGQIDSFDTAFKFLKFDVNSITDDMAIDVQEGSSSLYFEWVDIDIQDAGDSLVDSNAAAAPTVVIKFVKSDESGGAGKILKTKAASNLNTASTIFIDSRSTDNALQVSDWDSKITSGGNVNTTGSLLPVPADTIIVSPTMNLQGAIDSLVLTGRGGLITLLPGIYDISQPISIQGNNVQIVGYGDSSVIRASGFAGITSETAAVQVGATNGTGPVNGVILRDFKVEVGTVATSTDIHGIRFTGGRDHLVDNVTVQRINGTAGSGANAKIGIQMLDSTTQQLTRPIVRNSRVFGNGGTNYFTDGIHVTSDPVITGVFGYGQGIANALIDGNNVDFVRETGLVFYGANNSALFNNRVTRMGAAGTSAYGIYIGSSSNINMNANVFSGSLSTSAIGIGIEALNPSAARQTIDCIFDNNIIDGMGSGGVGFGVGFQLGNAGGNAQVHRNSLQSNAVLGASNIVTTAIQVRGNADDNTFSQSNISGGANPWDTGIALQSALQERNKIVVNRYNNITLILNDAGTDTQLGVTHHRVSANPTVNDDVNDGYGIGTIWINTSTNTTFMLVDSTAGAAVWNQIDNEVGSVSGTDANNFILDQDGTGGDVTLQFGTTITRLFGWDGTSNYISTFNNQLRFRVIQSSGIPFACGASVAGTQWMDTDTGIVYVCDSSNGRDKWLSMNDIVMYGENSGTCNSGADLNSSLACAVQWGGSLGPDTGTNLGFYIPYPITITGYGFAEDNDACTSGSFDLEAWSTGSNADDNNYSFETNIVTGLNGQAHNSNSLNIDVAGNQYIIWGMDNNCGQNIDDWNLILYYRWRHN